jgi:matrixin
MLPACLLLASPTAADPVALAWPQPAGPGTGVYITYSYSNLLDGTFLVITPEELRAATEEALELWAGYAPLHFIEQPDSGPGVSDFDYEAGTYPQIRIGHHVSPEIAHGYYPGQGGLAGDVHFASGVPWTVGAGHWNFLEAITHELGHSLGLTHELQDIAIMNPSYPFHRFEGLGSAFLYSSDIRRLQALYGAGVGSVQPLDPSPEPATYLLVLTGIAALARSRRRRRATTVGGLPATLAAFVRHEDVQ